MLIRIGEKIINKQKITQTLNQIFKLRQEGFSQQEVSNKLNIDRTFISRLETIGEVRKGQRVALIGFPIKNNTELANLANQEGIEYSLILSEKERWNFLENKSGLEVFNFTMQIIAEIKKFDIVIIVASDLRIKLVEALIDKDVIGIEIGESPINEDKEVDLNIIKKIINLINAKGDRHEKSS